jgi:AraC-like DNA-binding protein
VAGSEATVAAFDDDRRQFERILTKALRSRGNALTLARCADQLKLQIVEERARELINEESVVTDIDRGRALWSLLRETIERLRPADSNPEPAPAWWLYAIAEGVYVQGKSADETAAELNISPRTFHRERRAAVEALATVVWQTERQMYPRDATGGSLANSV